MLDFFKGKSEEPSRKELSDDEMGAEAFLGFTKETLRQAEMDDLEREMAEERAGRQRALGEGQDILDRAADREEEYLDEKFGDFLMSFPPEKNFDSVMQEKFGWTKHQTKARIGALKNEFRRFYNTEIEAPDEKRPEAGSRDSKTVLRQLFEEDYGQEFAASVTPLVDLFVDKSIEFIRKKEGGDDAQAV